jgi:hypothetical protein
MISNISNSELKEIKRNLPDYKKIIEQEDSYIENGKYKKIFISVFDHWISKEDASEMIFVDEKLNELIERRNKFKIFTEELYKVTDIYFWKYKRNYRMFLKRPLNYKDVLRKCDFDNLWSQSGNRYSMLLPEFSAIYSEAWDWTNIIWYTNEEKIAPILKIAEKARLNILK